MTGPAPTIRTTRTGGHPTTASARSACALLAAFALLWLLPGLSTMASADEGTAPAAPPPAGSATSTGAGTPAADPSSTVAPAVVPPVAPPVTPPVAPPVAPPVTPPVTPAAGPSSSPASASAAVVPPGPAGEGGVEARFRRAGEDYEAGRFTDAAALYQSILNDGYDDPRVHYNLGNAWFKQGRLGLANLSYERALARNPSDSDAKENLAYANLLIADKVGPIEEEFPAKLLAAVERSFGPDRARRALAVLALLASAAMVPLWFRPSARTRALSKGALGVLLPLAAVVLLLGWIGAARPGSAEYAIVLGDSADGRSAPAADGTVLFTVHEGLKVEVRGEREGWMHIGLPNGLTGWIEASRAERI